MSIKLTNKQVERLIKYWTDSAKEDYKTAESLFENKRYHHCLFFCHLFIEKTLKALVAKNTRHHAPPIHNLVSLSKKTKTELDKNVKSNLAIINRFNLRARYDSYKREFYKIATKKYTEK